MNRLVFSPDGRMLASAGMNERTVHLWDTATGRELRVLGEEPGSRCSVVFSPDGKTLAIASADDKTVRLWDTATAQEIRQFQGEMGIYSLAFSPDGKILAAGETPEKDSRIKISPIHLWDVDTGKEVRRLPGQVFTVSSLVFSNDSKRLISGSSSAVVRIWDVETGKQVLPFAEHESFVMSVAFSPDGRSLATGSLDGTIRLWEPMSGKPIRVFESGVQPGIVHVAFSPDGRSLVSDRFDGSLRIWDVAAGRQTRRIPVGKDRHCYPFAYSPDGRTLAVWREDGSVRLLDADTGKEPRRLAGAASDEAYLCFSSDSAKLACLSHSHRARGGVLHLWDVATGAEIHRWQVAEPGPVIFSPDGRCLIGGAGKYSLPAGTKERTFHNWDVATGEDHAFKAAQPAWVNCLAVSPDGRMLAWGDEEGTITLWELSAGQPRRLLKGHQSHVESLAFSPDGKTLASGNADTTALLWDVPGRPADSHISALSSDGFAILWNDLASKDACKAFDAIGLLTASPGQATPLLKSKLRPAPKPAERGHVARLIADLDSSEFAIREKAMEKLRQLGERAEPGLREALQQKPALEACKRIEELLEGVRMAAASPDNLRNLRAIEVLEHIDTPDAREVLKMLADGPAAARLTREARTSLERLYRRTPAKP